MPLIITRLRGEAIRLRIGDTVVWVSVALEPTRTPDHHAIRIDAPPGVEIVREELLEPDEQRQGQRRDVVRPGKRRKPR